MRLVSFADEKETRGQAEAEEGMQWVSVLVERRWCVWGWRCSQTDTRILLFYASCHLLLCPFVVVSHPMAAEIRPYPGATGPQKLQLISKLEGHQDVVNAAVILKGEDGVVSISDDKLVTETSSHFPLIPHHHHLLSYNIWQNGQDLAQAWCGQLLAQCLSYYARWVFLLNRTTLFNAVIFCISPCIMYAHARRDQATICRHGQREHNWIPSCRWLQSNDSGQKLCCTSGPSGTSGVFGGHGVAAVSG